MESASRAVERTSTDDGVAERRDDSGRTAGSSQSGREPTGEDAASEATVDEAAAFRLLGNARRRSTLRAVGNDGVLRLSELATRIARAEAVGAAGGSLPESKADSPLDEVAVDQAQYKSVYVSLQQTHLPTLRDAGVVEYDAESNVVRAAAGLDDVQAYLQPRRSEAKRWSLRAVLAVGLVGLLLVAAAGLGVPGVASVGAGVWGALSLAAVTLGLSLVVGGVVE